MWVGLTWRIYIYIFIYIHIHVFSCLNMCVRVFVLLFIMMIMINHHCFVFKTCFFTHLMWRVGHFADRKSGLWKELSPAKSEHAFHSHFCIHSNYSRRPVYLCSVGGSCRRKIVCLKNLFPVGLDSMNFFCCRESLGFAICYMGLFTEFCGVLNIATRG